MQFLTELDRQDNLYKQNKNLAFLMCDVRRENLYNSILLTLIFACGALRWSPGSTSRRFWWRETYRGCRGARQFVQTKQKPRIFMQGFVNGGGEWIRTTEMVERKGL